MKSSLKTPLLSLLNHTLVDLRVPLNINSWWSVGSMLGVMVSCQICTGLWLSMHYFNHTSLSFFSILSIHYNVVGGWLFHYLHMNGASMVFILIYLHLARGLMHSAYLSSATWALGIVLLIVMMGIAFMGYVLPWGQMSFWGATVITNLISAIPILGETLVEWVWGGFSVSTPTLTRLYSLHFLLPFALLLLVVGHLVALHQSGSSNPLGLTKSYSELTFHPFFTISDLIGFSSLLIGLVLLSCFYPEALGDSENFSPANSMVTPIHIQPEWYFLFAYAILRSIPNKLGGVVAMFLALVALYPLTFGPSQKSGLKFNPLSSNLALSLLLTALLLTWLGMSAATFPFNSLSALFSLVYFSLLLCLTWPIGALTKTQS